MSIQILGDKKKRMYDEGLIDVVNEKYANEVINIDIPSVEVPLPYNFEQRAYRLEGRERKHRLTNTASFKRIKEAGYERHLTCQEYFSILLNIYKSNSEETKALLKDMTFDYGEWLNHIFQTKQDESLVIYQYPDNLALWGDISQYTSKITIPASEFRSVARGKPIDFMMFGNKFLEVMFGMKAEDFPEELCKGKDRLKIRLPTFEEVFCPVSIGNYSEQFVLAAHSTYAGYFPKRASRGIKEDKVKKSVDDAENNFPLGGII